MQTLRRCHQGTAQCRSCDAYRSARQTLQGVVDDDREPWIYTIGLRDGFDHPELICAGPNVNTCARVLTILSESILEGERYTSGECLTVGTTAVRLGAVNPVQYALDTFAVWHELAHVGVIKTPQLSAFAGDRQRCSLLP